MAQNPQMAMSSTNLYHYTTKEGRDGILNQMFINASSGTTDGRTGRTVPARYGTGVYFTSYRPRNSRDEIIKRIYDDGEMATSDKWENLNYEVTISKEVRDLVAMLYAYSTEYILLFI